MHVWREQEKKSHIKFNWSAGTVVFITSSNTKYNWKGSYTCTLPLPLWELTVAKLYRLYPSQMAKYFVTIRNRCCQDSLDLWLSQSLAVLDFLSGWRNHSTDTFHLCAVAPLGFPHVFAFLCLSSDFFLIPLILQIYSGFLFSSFSLHINLLRDFP